jgi:hypothetical protein
MYVDQITRALPFVDSDDEGLNASSDYFRMVREGEIDVSTRAAWRSFLAGYRAVGRVNDETKLPRRRGGGQDTYPYILT